MAPTLLPHSPLPTTARRAPPPVRKRARAVLGIAALLLAVAALPGILANGASDEAEWQELPRVVSAQSEGTGLVLRSTHGSEEAHDALTARYDPSTATLTMALAALDPEPGTVAAAIAFQAVTSFVDQDGDGQQDVGEHIVRRMPVAGTPAVTAVQALGAGGWRITATHSLPPTAGNLDGGRVRIALDAWPTSVGGAPDPTTFTLDVTLIDVAAGNGTHVALETTFESTRAPSDVSSDLAAVESQGYRLALRWLEPGHGDVVEGGGLRQTFIRSAPADGHASHDASLVASRPASAAAPSGRGPVGSAVLYGLAAVVAVAAVALPAIRRWRE